MNAVETVWSTFINSMGFFKMHKLEKKKYSKIGHKPSSNKHKELCGYIK